MFKIYKIRNLIILSVIYLFLFCILILYITPIDVNSSEIQLIKKYEYSLNDFYLCKMINHEIINRQNKSNTENIIEDENIEKSYIDMQVPENKNFMSYMDAKYITNKTSDQYQLKSEYILDYNTGIYMINGRYACALGSYYTTQIGTEFDIVMKSGDVIPCILADCKADEHTDVLGQYTLANNSVVEFVVDEHILVPYITTKHGNTGNVAYLRGVFDNEIDYIRVYKDEVNE